MPAPATVSSINGLHLLFYGLFVGLPLFISLALFLAEGRRSLRVFKIGQNPLPGEKVFKPTKYRYGKRAKILPLLVLLSIAFLPVSRYGAPFRHRS